MGKGMGPCLCIGFVYLDRIVPRFGFYVHKYENACVVLICYVKGLLTYMYTLTCMMV